MGILVLMPPTCVAKADMSLPAGSIYMWCIQCTLVCLVMYIYVFIIIMKESIYKE